MYIYYVCNSYIADVLFNYSPHRSCNADGLTVTVRSYFTSQLILMVRSLPKRLPSILKYSGRWFALSYALKVTVNSDAIVNLLASN